MRALSMQALTRQLQERHPGIVIGGIGDAAHKLEASGHNEDDTAGVRAEDQDDDSIPEHRALDPMLGPSFTKADADALVADLVGNEANRSRLLYVIFNRKIWSRSRGWAVRDYTGSNPHTDHVHVSGEADADGNTSDWVLSGFSTGDDDMFCGYGDQGSRKVEAYQRLLLVLDPGCLPRFGADGGFGDETAGAGAQLVGGDGRTYGPAEYAALMVKIGALGGGGTPGPQGPPGPVGPQGEPGVPGPVPTHVTLELTGVVRPA